MFVHVIYDIKLIAINLFKFPCLLFNVCRVCSDVSSLIPNNSNLCFISLFFFPWLVSLGVIQFFNLFPSTNFWLCCFPLFSVFYFIASWSYLYFILSSLLGFNLIFSVSWSVTFCLLKTLLLYLAPRSSPLHVWGLGSWLHCRSIR